jgi:hypothetical protein
MDSTIRRKPVLLPCGEKHLAFGPEWLKHLKGSMPEQLWKETEPLFGRDNVI